MIAGVQPFKALTSYLSMEKTKKAEYSVPEGFDPTALDLVRNLLVVDPKQRLGDAARGGPELLRMHPFFDGVDWPQIWVMDPPPLEAGLVKKVVPPPRARGAPRSTEFEDDSDDSDTASSPSVQGGRGAAWAALVQDLSEDEMDDERTQSYARSARSGPRSAKGAVVEEGSSERDSSAGPAVPIPASAPIPVPSTSHTQSEGSARPSNVYVEVSPGFEVSRSPDRGRLEGSLPNARRPSRAGEVLVWDSQYPRGQSQSQPRSSAPFPPTEVEHPDVVVRLSEEMRANGGSPVSSSGTSSTGRSEDLGGQWAHLLNSGEKALFCTPAHLKSRAGMFRGRVTLKPRLLVLTDQLRFLCIKNTTRPASSHGHSHSYSQGGGDDRRHAEKETSVTKIKTEVLLASPPSGAPSGSASGSAPAAKSPPPAPSSRRGSSVGQGANGPMKRRLSVSTTASRISLRGRSLHRRGVELLTGADATKGDGSLVIQTVCLIICVRLFHRLLTYLEYRNLGRPMVYICSRQSNNRPSVDPRDPCCTAATTITGATQLRLICVKVLQSCFLFSLLLAFLGCLDRSPSSASFIALYDSQVHLISSPVHHVIRRLLALTI